MVAENFNVWWVQFNCEGGLSLRIITKESVPPQVLIDQEWLTLKLRSPAQEPYFPIWVWEISLPSNAQTITIEKTVFSIPNLSLKKIAFLGDTGCRPDQPCDPEHWPLETVVGKIAAENPELIIHLGDYIYRHRALRKRNAVQIISIIMKGIIGKVGKRSSLHLSKAYCKWRHGFWFEAIKKAVTGLHKGGGCF